MHASACGLFFYLGLHPGSPSPGLPDALAFKLSAGDNVDRSLPRELEVSHDDARLESLFSGRTLRRQNEWRVGVPRDSGAGEVAL
jgi:hypothetical protein